ncbi:inositol-3-phosphate synthase [Anatilimnocola floriformis]|uniref:inositol-3-phosphate synthase n=1 Tax=Anatilimnocola floriformis TaxID=2948575 RepID=UPI0020C445AB|nr:inositol-3-phosphate synthase [Anatilimnocola floriformis]
MARRKIGLWIIGAKGGVASTVTVGLIALKKGLAPNHGLVTQLPQFANIDLAGFSDFTIGGHEIRDVNLYDEALQLVRVSKALDAELVAKCKTELDKIDKNIKPGTLWNVGSKIEEISGDESRKFKNKETPRAAIDRLQSDLKEFQSKHDLDQVVVVNLASTEPPVDEAALPAKWKDLSKTLAKKTCALPASSLYAIAALELGLPFVNFTPSLGSAAPAIQELAIEKETCHMGHDGKTGETLMKSVLAPMFALRNLPVMSWVGHNIFGNLDGKVLDDPANKKTKVRSKDRLLHQILGYSPQTLVSIEYIESLGDWKTAWDHIHFQGFLGLPMVLTFQWQGADSLLAAPLVIDLVRLTERAHRNGDRGLLTFLASFFKSPIGVANHNFVEQFQMLQAWAEKVEKMQRL